MSSGYSCPCHFKWSLDTQGLKRDPINCEKGWLDYAVRFLSREAVGKGKGQEAVWSEKCRPQWWNEQVGLPWKNPTANPKDTKDVLQRKYSALESHLRSSGRFPSELEEEAVLWRDGKHKELFLFTSLTSLLGKAKSIHCSVEDIQIKVDEVNAKVNTEMLDGIKDCLKSTLGAIENLYSQKQANDHKTATVKRKARELIPHVGKENDNFFAVSPKIRKVSEVSEINVASDSEEIFKQSRNDSIIALARKLSEKRKNRKSFNTGSKFQKIKPKTTPPGTPSSSVPAIITVSPEELSKLLKTNAVNFIQPVANENSVSSCHMKTQNIERTNKSENIMYPPFIVNETSGSTLSPGDMFLRSCGISDDNLTLDSNAFSSNSTPVSPNDHLKSYSPKALSPVVVSSPSPVFESSLSNRSSSCYSSSYLSDLESYQDCSDPVYDKNSISPKSDIVFESLMSSGPNNSNITSVETTGTIQNVSDVGYWSDDGTFESLFPGEGQKEQLFNEDGSFRLEDFLFDV